MVLAWEYDRGQVRDGLKRLATSVSWRMDGSQDIRAAANKQRKFRRANFLTVGGRAIFEHLEVNNRHRGKHEQHQVIEAERELVPI